MFNKKTVMDMASTFVLRRAWLIGICTRADIDRAFGTAASPNRGTAIMQTALRTWPSHLRRVKHHGIFPRRESAAPDQAQAETVFDLLASGARPEISGLFPDDGVPVIMPTPPRALPIGNATSIVLHAALNETAVDILYAGLRLGEVAKWRRVLPRALEFTGRFWRLRAQDVVPAGSDRKAIPAAAETSPEPVADAPIKTFVMARILDAASVHRWTPPPGFKRKNIVLAYRKLRVHFSDRLTDDQKRAVCNQLDIHDGVMTWPEHASFDVVREFAGADVRPGVVWPVLSRVDDLGPSPKR